MLSLSVPADEAAQTPDLEQGVCCRRRAPAVGRRSSLPNRAQCRSPAASEDGSEESWRTRRYRYRYRYFLVSCC